MTDILHIERSTIQGDPYEADVVTTLCGMTLYITAEESTCTPPGHDAACGNIVTKNITCESCREVWSTGTTVSMPGTTKTKKPRKFTGVITCEHDLHVATFYMGKRSSTRKELGFVGNVGVAYSFIEMLEKLGYEINIEDNSGDE